MIHLLAAIVLADPYVIILPEVEATPGQAFEIPVTVEDALLMRALELTFEYNPAMMIIPDIGHGGIASPRLAPDSSAFATTMANFTMPGRAVIWWWDIDPMPAGERHLYTIDAMVAESAEVGLFQAWNVTEVIVDEKPHVTSYVGGTLAIVPSPPSGRLLGILFIFIGLWVLADVIRGAWDKMKD